MRTAVSEIVKVVVILTAFASPVTALINGTPHDLSAVAGGEVCHYCHTPHGAIANTPLWSHKLSNAVYKIYQSTSLVAKVGQPTGSSKLCLSCHDGTVAIASTVTGGPGGVYISPGEKNLGTDLSDDHPISFVYTSAIPTQNIQIRSASTLPSQLKLDRTGEVQCTTCHDAHNNQYGKFLTMQNVRSQMCVACHDMSGWQTASHQSSSASIAASTDQYLQKSQYRTVADNGCNSCHRPHSAGGPERLLHLAVFEENCLNCHDGSVAKTNLKNDIAKLSRHDIAGFSGIHDLKESPISSPQHVTCADCHNPHAAASLSANAPLVKGSIQKVSGITMSGGTTWQAQYEYEICFKCHGDNPNRIESKITRQITQTNSRLEFQPTNPSFHPVIAAGTNIDVPSLIAPLTVTSMLYCTDCHNSDSASGTKGPHGSMYSPLLSDNYQTSDFTSESSFAYALCYKCHSRTRILNDESFRKHKIHIVDKQIPCSACHDAHGINSGQGNAINNSNLINFDTTIVRLNSKGILKFEDMGKFSGQCYLQCHGKDHNPETYGP